MTPEKAVSATIHSETAAKLNFACHQNAFAFLRDLRIESKGPVLNPSWITCWSRCRRTRLF